MLPFKPFLGQEISWPVEQAQLPSIAPERRLESGGNNTFLRSKWVDSKSFFFAPLGRKVIVLSFKSETEDGWHWLNDPKQSMLGIEEHGPNGLEYMWPSKLVASFGARIIWQCCYFVALNVNLVRCHDSAVGKKHFFESRRCRNLVSNILTNFLWRELEVPL